MNTRMSHAARAALVGVAMAAVSVAAAGTASGEPVTRLPDADLVCGSTTFDRTQWVTLPGSDTLWVKDGQLAGHYVILTDTHYVVPGYLTEPPPTYDDLVGVTITRGTKRGLAGQAITCDFVSRWGLPGDPETFSVVGPVTMVRVPG